MSESFPFHKAKEQIMRYTRISISRKTALFFILIFTALSVLDSTIVEFSTYSGVRIPTWLNITIFLIFFIIFVGGSIILVNSVWNTIALYTSKQGLPFGLRFFHILISATLILMIVMTLVIIL